MSTLRHMGMPLPKSSPHHLFLAPVRDILLPSNKPAIIPHISKIYNTYICPPTDPSAPFKPSNNPIITLELYIFQSIILTFRPKYSTLSRNFSLYNPQLASIISLLKAGTSYYGSGRSEKEGLRLHDILERKRSYTQGSTPDMNSCIHRVR